MKILIVDDNEMNRSLLADMLPGYDLLEASNGVQAINILQRQGSELDLILLDIVMPELSGFDVLDYMVDHGFIRDIPVVMISSEDDPDNIQKAFEMGVSDFIPRPFNELIVGKRVSNTLKLHARQKKLIGVVNSQIHEAEQSTSMLIDVLANVVEFRNSECGSHIHNVRTLTKMFLEELMREHPEYGFSQGDISVISMVSALHDIGKIAIPSEVLNKPGKLTDEEFAVMKTHSALGDEILERQVAYKDARLMQLARDICRWHHERWDGRGYPDGIAGEDIPIHAQVVALADVYDALTSKRCYKDAFAHENAVRMILNGECGQFNPVLMECLRNMAEGIPGELAKDRTMETYDEAMRLTGEVLGRENVQVSDRTLRLLEHERMKQDLFAAMSDEVQFEFTLRTMDSPQCVTISSFGAQKLGLPESIENPLLDGRVTSVISDYDLQRLSAMVRSTSPKNPSVEYECKMTVKGERRWYKVTVWAIWSTDEPPRYVGAVGKAVDIHDTRVEREDLIQRASCDSLTGLLNHATARVQIEQRLHERPDGLHAMMVLDLDKFKEANDMCGGHAFGDELLRHFADKLRNVVRGGDIVARVGGDEFMIFLEYKEMPETPGVAIERIFKGLCGEYGGFDITLSMGVALTSDIGTDYDELFRAADAAAYRSKHDGRNRFTLYDESMRGESESNISPVESDGKGADGE